LHPKDILARAEKKIELIAELCLAKLDAQDSIDVKAIEGLSLVVNDLRDMIQAARQAI